MLTLKEACAENATFPRISMWGSGLMIAMWGSVTPSPASLRSRLAAFMKRVARRGLLASSTDGERLT